MIAVGTFAKMDWAWKLRDIPPEAKLLAIYFSGAGHDFSVEEASEWSGIPVAKIVHFLSLIPPEVFAEISRSSGREVGITWPAVLT